MPEYRQVTDAQIEGYIAYWKIGKLKSFERMTAGIANSNYKVVTDQGTFLLKICEEGRIDKIQVCPNIVLYDELRPFFHYLVTDMIALFAHNLKHQLEALLQLKKFDFPTAYPYPLVEKGEMKETEYDLVNTYALREPEPLGILFNFLDGKPGVNYESSEKRMYSLGVACGKLSIVPAPRPFLKRTMKFPPGESIKPLMEKIRGGDALYEHPFVTNYLRSKLPTLLGLIRNERLPRAITHGDIFLDNCLWSEETESMRWMLDFEEVCYEPAILDVAMTILGCCHEKEDGELKVEWVKAFLSGYCSVRTLTHLECDLLPSMMQFCIIAASFWRFNQFVVLHPELGMQESYRELCMRGEEEIAVSTSSSTTSTQASSGKKRTTFQTWWNSPEIQTWRQSYLLDQLAQPLLTFNSTRGDLHAGGKSFREALFGGYAADGGLFVPAQLPRFTLDDLVSMHKQSYATITKRLLRHFISTQELSTQQLEQIVDDALATFDHPEVLPLVPLKHGPGSTTGQTQVHIMEMFHGTTGAFKDLSMSIIGRLMQAFLSQDSSSNSSKFKTIVVGTSGDTGSAAIHAVRACPSVEIIVLYPHGRVSKIQELQMITEKKAHVFAVDGTSDDLDVPIKKVLSDRAFVEENQLCSINSINLARVAIQSAHFFYAYAQLVSKEMIGKSSLIASIPCGACGDLVGALMAREMGLPLRLVAAVNENDIVKRTMESGKFQTGESVVVSTSPSMDIQVPYNWERVVYYASGGDVEGVKQFMEQFEANPKNGAQMDSEWHKALLSFLSSSSVSKADVAQITKATYASDGYILDPHTAVGLKGYLNLDDSVNSNHWDPVVILSTATPHKFDESVKPTLGLDALPNVPTAFQGLDKLETFAKPMKKGEDWEASLRSTIIDITKKRKQQH